MITEMITENTVSESATPVLTIFQTPLIKPTKPTIAYNMQIRVIANGLFAMSENQNYSILKKPRNNKK